jgi:hypothetical protein
MLEEQKINAKKKRENVKRLRDEASYEERLLSYARRDENEEIIANVREHFTAEQIANKEYLQLFKVYENPQLPNLNEKQFWYLEKQINGQGNMLMDINKRLEMLEDSIKGNYEGTSMDINYIKGATIETNRKLEMLRGRIYDLEEGNPSIYQPLESFDA